MVIIESNVVDWVNGAHAGLSVTTAGQEDRQWTQTCNWPRHPVRGEHQPRYTLQYPIHSTVVFVWKQKFENRFFFVVAVDETTAVADVSSQSSTQQPDEPAAKKQRTEG